MIYEVLLLSNNNVSHIPMIDSRTFLSIFSKFQVALLVIMGFFALWNHWTVYYDMDFSSTIATMIVLTLFYIYINSHNSNNSSVSHNKQKYVHYIGFSFVFFILLNFYFELAGSLTNALVVNFIVLFIAFLYSRFCYNKWLAMIIKLSLILFLFYLTPMNIINKGLNFYQVNIMQLYSNAKIISATASQYEYRATKQPTKYLIAFNNDINITNCSYIFQFSHYCLIENFDNIIGNQVIIKISNDNNNYLLAIYDYHGKEIYNFYNHYQNRQKSEYVWAWFYKIQYYIFLIFVILLPLPKQNVIEEINNAP